MGRPVRRPIGPPTEAELDILRVLWSRGQSTVREVHDAVGPEKRVGYTTVLKQMRVMFQKGLLVRSERFRSHLYHVAQERSVIERQLASTILRRVFDGSARGLLQSALAGRKVDRRELAEIRQLLDEYERRNR
jgi:BlaI family penicillinase repressor